MNRNRIVIAILLAILSPTASFPERPASEAPSESDVSVSSKPPLNQKTTVPKANTTYVLRLTPLSSPPPNPSAGDIYFSINDELFIYAKGKWTPIFSASANHGAQHLTSGSGTWTVPAGIYALRVTLVGGGGGGGPASSYRNKRESFCKPGRSGGNGGVRLGVYMDVAPGQHISYSVGSGGSAGITECPNVLSLNCVTSESRSGGPTVFGHLSVSGGRGGSPKAGGLDGSPSGIYPYGFYGQGGGGSGCSRASQARSAGAPGASGAIYIQY